MSKLEDYSGEFNPHLRPSDFSYDALEKLIKTYAQLYKALDGFWYLALMEKSGNDAALTCDIAVWEKLCGYEMEKITKNFNIQGKDVKSLMKAFQLSPWAWNLKWDFEVLGENHIIWKVTHCPTVKALEREGRGRENDICNNVEVRLNRLYASFFNPAIQVNCLKTPPRESPEDYYCRWEFKM